MDPKGMSLVETEFFNKFKKLDWRRKMLVKFIVCQEEIAPETGRHHLQGYIRFLTKVRPFSGQMKKKNPHFFWSKVHWSPADFVEQSIKYAQKAKTRAQHGYILKAGEALNPYGDTIVGSIQQIDMGVPIDEILSGNPKTTFMYKQKIIQAFMDKQPLRHSDGSGIDFHFWIFMGPSGVGKTRLAKTFEPGAPFPELGTFRYTMPSRNQDSSGRLDLDMYMGENVIIINEFSSSMYKLDKMKLFLDGEAGFQFGKKNYNMQSRSSYMIMTTNFDPTTMYSTLRYEKGDAICAPLQRRIRQYGTIYDVTRTCTCVDPWNCTCGNFHRVTKRNYAPGDGFTFGTRANEVEPTVIIPKPLEDMQDEDGADSDTLDDDEESDFPPEEEVTWQEGQWNDPNFIGPINNNAMQHYIARSDIPEVTLGEVGNRADALNWEPHRTSQRQLRQLEEQIFLEHLDRAKAQSILPNDEGTIELPPIPEDEDDYLETLTLPDEDMLEVPILQSVPGSPHVDQFGEQF